MTGAEITDTGTPLLRLPSSRRTARLLKPSENRRSSGGPQDGVAGRAAGLGNRCRHSAREITASEPGAGSIQDGASEANENRGAKTAGCAPVGAATP